MQGNSERRCIYCTTVRIGGIKWTQLPIVYFKHIVEDFGKQVALRENDDILFKYFGHIVWNDWSSNPYYFHS